MVGAEAYGKYFALVSLVFIFNILLDLGITNYVNRHVANNLKETASITGNALIAKIILSFVYSGIIYLIAKASGIVDNRLLWLLILLQILTSFLLFGRGILSANQLFKTDAVLSVTDRVLLIIIAGFWFYSSVIHKAFTIYDFAGLQVITVGFALLLCVFFLLKQDIFRTLFISRKGVFNILLQSIPFALTVFFMGVHNRTDAFLLERLHTNGAYEAGIYAAAYRLLDASNMVGYLFSSILISYWSKHGEQKQELEKSLLLSHQLLVPAGVLVATASFFLKPELYKLLYHHNSLYGSEILGWCLISLIPYFVIHLYGTMLTATGHIKTYMWLVLQSAIINVVANWIFIPSMGAKACVIISLCSQSLLALLTICFVKKQAGLSVSYLLWIKYLLIGLIVGITAWALRKTEITIWIILFIIMAVWFLAVNLFQIFSIRSFLKLMSKK